MYSTEHTKSPGILHPSVEYRRWDPRGVNLGVKGLGSGNGN